MLWGKPNSNLRMSASYSDKQARSLHFIGVPFAMISILGSILVFGVYFLLYGGGYNPSNVAKRFSSIKPIHEFVLLIALSNLIGSTGNILGIGYPYQENITLCKSREILTVFGGVSSFLLSWIMSFIMYMTIFHPQNTLYFKLLIQVKMRRVIEIVIFVSSLTVSLAPYPILCSDDAYHARLIFYIPMFITLIFISFCYLRIIYYFCKQKNDGNNIDERDLRIYKNIRWYPGIMLFCLSWGAFRRIYQVITNGNEPPFGFALMQIISMYSYGAIISFVFMYNVKLYKNSQDLQQNVNDNKHEEQASEMISVEITQDIDTQDITQMIETNVMR